MTDAEAIAVVSKTVGGLVAKSVQYSLNGVLFSSCLSSVPPPRCCPMQYELSSSKPSYVGRAIIVQAVFCRMSRHGPSSPWLVDCSVCFTGILKNISAPSPSLILAHEASFVFIIPNCELIWWGIEMIPIHHVFNHYIHK